MKNDIVRALFEHRVVEINLQNPYRLASGRESPVYFDLRRIFSVPGLRENVISSWASELTEHWNKLRATNSALPQLKECVIAGTATAGIAPAFGLASKLELPFMYVRAKPKGHGLGRMIEGVWPGGETPVIMVDDMITTGGSLFEAATHVTREYGRVVLATSVSRHDFNSTRTTFEDRRIPLWSLFTTREIFDTARAIEVLGATEHRAMMDWLDRS